MFETKSTPEIVKLCSEETIPLQAAKLVNEPEEDSVGVAPPVKIVAVTAVRLAEIHPVVVFLACA